MFIEKHKVYGNKWAEIGKFLDGRNDNAVKNYFYSSMRKTIRKISLKKVTYDLKENEIEKELTIYLSQYVLQMYRDYLDKKRREINIKRNYQNNIDSNGDYSMDLNDEENKEEKDEPLKSGDKYIIRKLISLKISPEHIEEYISMLITGNTNPMMQNMYPVMNYSGYTPIMNQVVYETPAYLSIPQYTIPHRSNSQYNGEYNNQYIDIHNYCNNDWHSSQNDMSLENNFSSNNDPLSSLPLHMRGIRPFRSHSITNRLPESSSYMKDAFLFDKIKQTHYKDDNTLEKEYSPLFVDNQEPKSFVPKILKYNAMDFENMSNSSYSSQSSAYSFSDAGSASSLDLSFDGSGMPYLKSYKASAFAKVQNNDKSEHSNSLSDHSQSDSEGGPKGPELIPNTITAIKADSKPLKKSSFFRLRIDNDREANPDDVQ